MIIIDVHFSCHTHHISDMQSVLWIAETLDTENDTAILITYSHIAGWEGKAA